MMKKLILSLFLSLSIFGSCFGAAAQEEIFFHEIAYDSLDRATRRVLTRFKLDHGQILGFENYIIFQIHAQRHIIGPQAVGSPTRISAPIKAAGYIKADRIVIDFACDDAKTILDRVITKVLDDESNTKINAANKDKYRSIHARVRIGGAVDKEILMIHNGRFHPFSQKDWLSIRPYITELILTESTTVDVPDELGPPLHINV